MPLLQSQRLQAGPVHFCKTALKLLDSFSPTVGDSKFLFSVLNTT